MVFLSDGSVFEYEARVLMWRQVSGEVTMPTQQSRSNQDHQGYKPHSVANVESVSSIIKLLEVQSLEEQNPLLNPIVEQQTLHQANLVS